MQDARVSTLVGCLVRDPTSPRVPGALDAAVRACTPVVEPHTDEVVVFDATGLDRVIGPPAELARAVLDLAAAHGVTGRLALAGTRVAAWLLAHAHPGSTLVSPGDERQALASLPIETLTCLPEDMTSGASATAPPGRSGRRPARARHYRLAPEPPRTVPRDGVSSELVALLHTWGIHTLGALATLPRAEVRARLGLVGVRVHQAACGEDVRPLVPAPVTRRFVERLELDWPIEGLEPLAFALGRLCEAHEAALVQADRGAVTIETRLMLVTRACHVRTLHVPAPMRDARVLRTLILLDLESHPPPAAIDQIEVELGVTPGQIAQGGLFARLLPAPESLTTLLARLGALMGESRIGAPVVVDSYDDRDVGVTAFTPPAVLAPVAARIGPTAAVRRFPMPIAVEVTVDRGRPVQVRSSARGLAGGAVTESAGPWRSSGRWWTLAEKDWDRDVWDVALASGGIYRLARHRATGRWDLEGALD